MHGIAVGFDVKPGPWRPSGCKGAAAGARAFGSPAISSRLPPCRSVLPGREIPGRKAASANPLKQSRTFKALIQYPVDT